MKTESDCVCNAGFGMNLSCPVHGANVPGENRHERALELIRWGLGTLLTLRNIFGPLWEIRAAGMAVRDPHEEGAANADALAYAVNVVEAAGGVEGWMVEWAGYVELVGGDEADHAKSAQVQNVLRAIVNAKAKGTQ
jgi:hypothetical protein